MIVFGPYLEERSHRNIYFDNQKAVGVQFEKRTNVSLGTGKTKYMYTMRFFIHEPFSMNGTNWGNRNWEFNGRKDFFRRKGEMENMCMKFLNQEKEYMLTRIFENE